MKDHLDKPVKQVLVRMVERQLFRQGRDQDEMPCPESSTSHADGLAVFICNTPREAVKVVLKVRRRRKTSKHLCHVFHLSVITKKLFMLVIVFFFLLLTCHYLVRDG